MKIALLGYGLQGQAAYKYWNKPGNEVVICDADINTKVPDGATSRLGPDYLYNLSEFDLLVRTPRLHPRDILAANREAPDILDRVTTVTDEFMQVCPSKNIIGVTGTKGKGTTSTLIAKMLEAAGKKVHLGGNIGTPPLEMLTPSSGENIQPDDWVVLELANFQLIDVKHSPHIAVCLMVVAEHMDWHSELGDYIAAKQQMFRHQSPDDIAIYYALNPTSEHIASISPGHKIPFMKHPGADVLQNNITIDQQIICSVDELKLLGAHNWQNACAAVTAVWQVVKNPQAIKSVLTTFTGLPHRLEFVRELNKVKYYDDSFGTTPETAIVAIQAFEVPKVVILGGSDKGATYEGLAATVLKNNVRAVVTIGNTGPAIAQALHSAGYNNIVEGGRTMTDIVNTARTHAQPGDIVLLSTGCASFGLFKDYKDRGEQFKAAVQALGAVDLSPAAQVEVPLRDQPPHA